MAERWRTLSRDAPPSLEEVRWRQRGNAATRQRGNAAPGHLWLLRHQLLVQTK